VKFTVITAFPELIDEYCSKALLGKARERALVQIEALHLRDFADPPHFAIDDRPYGGGAGMVLRCEPIVKALRSLPSSGTKILLSAKGKPFTQKTAHRFLGEENIVLICGRYEGVDQRIADHYVDEEIRVGDFVLMGGEIAALSIIEATSRLVPGVLGNEASPEEESFENDEGVEYPQYTRPRTFEDHEVPEALLSGDHAKIKRWRSDQRKKS